MARQGDGMVREAHERADGAPRRRSGRPGNGWLGHRLVLMLSPWYSVQAMMVPIIFPDRHRALQRTAYVALYVAVVVAAACTSPWLLVPIGIIAVAATLAGLWSSRSSAGRREGLPPGRVPPVNLAPLLDREFFRRQVRRHGAVFKSISPTSPVRTVCIASLSSAVATLRHHEHDLGPIRQNPFDELIPGRLVRHMRGDTHRQYRRVFHDAFDDAVLVTCRAGIGADLDRGLALVAAACARRAGRGVAPRAMIERDVLLPVFLRVFLGLDPESATAQRATTLLLTIDQRVARTEPRLPEYAAVVAELDRLVRALAAELQAAPESSEMSTPRSFLGALLARHPEALADPVVLRNLIFNLRIGLRDLTGLVDWTLKLLAEHPDEQARVRAATDVPATCGRVVMECLRMQQSELLYRTIERDIDIDGYLAPAGSLLRVCVHESHRDPEVFPDPDRFDPDRFGRTYSRTEYSPLGIGTHACLGAGMVHAVTARFVERLCLGYRASVVADGRPVLRTGWQPSKRYRVELVRLP